MISNLKKDENIKITNFGKFKVNKKRVEYITKLKNESKG